MNYRAERVPIVTFTLIGINTLVYLVLLVFQLGTDDRSELWIRQYLWLVPAKSFPWAYLTSMFAHADMLHLVGNMLFLFLFGCCVEDMIGRARFLAYYLVSGLVAELVYIATLPEHFASTIPMCGASGAISACMGMYLLLRADAKIEFKYFFWFFYIRVGEFEIPAWVAISFWFVNSLFWAVIGFLSDQEQGGVAFGAHVGGLLAGLGLISVYKLVTKRHEEPAANPEAALVPATTVAAGTRPGSMLETPAIHLYEAGKQSGPFTLSQVQAMLACGALGKEALYWSEGMADWQNVAELSSQPSG